MADKKGKLKKVMTSIYNKEKQVVEKQAAKEKPQSRKKYKAKWDDEVKRYNHIKKYRHNGASSNIDDTIKEARNPVKTKRDRDDTFRAAQSVTRQRKGVKVVKYRAPSPAYLFEPAPPRINNTDTSAASAKAHADSWKITPEAERKTQRLTPKIQGGGGGYFPEQAKTWKGAMRRYEALKRIDSTEKNLRQSSLVGVDSPKAKLEQDAAGLDHMAKDAQLKYALYKTGKEDEQRQKVKKVKKAAQQKKKDFKNKLEEEWKREEEEWKRRNRKYKKRWKTQDGESE